MTTLYEDTNPRPLHELLGEVQAGTSVLPDFQRDFVWDPGEVAELILSIANNYPAGSLLRIRNSHEHFSWRSFEGAQQPPGKPTFLVLDGQQRLTSLYQAFYGRGPNRFFIDVGKLIAGEDLEEALFYCRADRAPATELLPKSDSAEHRAAAQAAQAAKLIFPLGAFRASRACFAEWKGEVVRARADADGMDAAMALMSDMDKVAEQWLAPIDNYVFPVVTLSDRTSAAAICTIFETLNRTGVKLTPFELLTARFFAQDLNLRTLWREAREQNPIFEEFEIDPYAILQAITMRVNRPITAKRSALMNLTHKQILETWNSTVAALAEGLIFLREECGVIIPKWLPYGSMLTPLAAALADRPLTGGVGAGTRRSKLKRWFWCATLGQVYESSANRKSELDYEQLVAWFDGKDAPMSVTSFRFDPETLVMITPRQRASYRALMCLTLAGGARDFHSHQQMTAALVRSNLVDDHHLFPLDFLGEKDRRRPNPKFDCILNRTLIDAETNRRIGANSPADYLGAIEKEQGVQLVDDILQSHGIDSEARAAMRSADYDAFLARRRQHFEQRVELATRQEEASVAEAAAE